MHEMMKSQSDMVSNLEALRDSVLTVFVMMGLDCVEKRKEELVLISQKTLPRSSLSDAFNLSVAFCGTTITA